MLEKQQFHYINFPTLEMRKAPEIKAEIVSQGIFSEEIYILEEQENWVKIQTVIDHYIGWVKKEGIHSRTTPFLNESDSRTIVTNCLATHLYDCGDTIYGPILTLPFESKLAAFDLDKRGDRWIKVTLPDSRKAYIQRGNISLNKIQINLLEISCFAQSFLGLPYTWGGRSSFGYDCSGFVQMLYRQLGIFLPRDSKDQMKAPDFIDHPIKSLTTGDLLFFGFSHDQIKHVGFFLENGKFIHTSAVTENKPYVRISHINDKAWNGSGYYPFVTGRKHLH